MEETMNYQQMSREELIAEQSRLAKEYEIKDILYGAPEKIAGCDGLILRIFKK